MRHAVERAGPAARLVPAVSTARCSRRPRRRRPPSRRQWSAPAAAPTGRPSGQSQQKSPQRLPAGYRWIAVRPGAAPPPRRRPRNFGPTPRYAVIPRWGLVDHFDTASHVQQAEPRRGPTIGALRATLVATIAVLGLAAVVHIDPVRAAAHQSRRPAQSGGGVAGDVARNRGERRRRCSWSSRRSWC